MATLLPVSNTTRPFGWSMIHMLTGMVTSRCFSFGTVGIRPVIGNGPNMPLVVQYTPLTCANTADEPTRHSKPSSAAAIPDFFIALSPTPDVGYTQRHVVVSATWGIRAPPCDNGHASAC